MGRSQGKLSLRLQLAVKQDSQKSYNQREDKPKVDRFHSHRVGQHGMLTRPAPRRGTEPTGWQLQRSSLAMREVCSVKTTEQDHQTFLNFLYRKYEVAEQLI